MAKTFQLEILTPEKMFFEGEVTSLTLETPGGQIGVLFGHEPLAVGLPPGMITIVSESGTRQAVNGQGFAEVRPHKTTVLCQTMEWPEEVEENRVRRAIEEHELILKMTKSQVEYRVSKASLARAFARLRAIKK